MANRSPIAQTSFCMVIQCSEISFYVIIWSNIAQTSFLSIFSIAVFLFPKSLKRYSLSGPIPKFSINENVFPMFQDICLRKKSSYEKTQRWASLSSQQQQQQQQFAPTWRMASIETSQGLRLCFPFRPNLTRWDRLGESVIFWRGPF